MLPQRANTRSWSLDTPYPPQPPPNNQKHIVAAKVMARTRAPAPYCVSSAQRQNIYSAPRGRRRSTAWRSYSVSFCSPGNTIATYTRRQRKKLQLNVVLFNASRSHPAILICSLCCMYMPSTPWGNIMCAVNQTYGERTNIHYTCTLNNAPICVRRDFWLNPAADTPASDTPATSLASSRLTPVRLSDGSLIQRNLSWRRKGAIALGLSCFDSEHPAVIASTTTAKTMHTLADTSIAANTFWLVARSLETPAFSRRTMYMLRSTTACPVRLNHTSHLDA